MDREKTELKWSWLPAFMPGVVNLVAAKRVEVGRAHVDECWRRGVVLREPGWFFAREGALAVGTPWPEIAEVAGWQLMPKQAILFVRLPGGEHGA